jgi:hypothetical protein
MQVLNAYCIVLGAILPFPVQKIVTHGSLYLPGSLIPKIRYCTKTFAPHLVLVALVLCESNETVEEEISPTTTETPETPETYKVRLLSFEYEFESHTELSERNGLNVGNKKMDVKAKYGFDILHHDEAGKILGRYHVRLLHRL